MNYSTECLEHLLRFQTVLTKMGMTHDVLTLKAITSDLMRATKFILPPPDKMNVKVTKPALKLLRLPYPICAFEFNCPMAKAEGIDGVNTLTTSKSTKRIALAYDCRKDVGPVAMLKETGKLPKNAEGILVISLYYLDEMNLWNPSFGAGYMDEDTASENGEVLIDNKTIQAQIKIAPILTECISHFLGGMSRIEKGNTLINDVMDETAMATRACLMLNTKNLQVVKVSEAPEKLNKKRSKNNKPPFFEYHTIDIFFSESGNRVDRKQVNYGAIKDHFNNMALSKKWGTVMGHFKVRSTGIFWWSEHGRGNKSQGIIEKEYRLKPEPPKK